MSAQEDWKQKYRELALEVERTNQQGLKTEQALRQLVMQLGIALAGEDAELDGAMAVLRAHLQNGGTDSDKLFALTFPLEQLLQRYGQDRNGAVRQATQALEKWLKLLEIDSGSNPDRIAQLQSHLKGVEDSLQKLGPLLEELVEYVLQLSRPLSVDHVVPPESPTQPLEDVSSLLSQVRDEFRQLLTRITISDALKLKADQLLKHLDKGLSLPELPNWVSQLAQLLLQLPQGPGDEFERYLVEISERLAEVHVSVMSYRKIQAAGSDSQSQLQSDVQLNVAEMSAVVRDCHDLNVLKASVSRQLSGLEATMQAFSLRERKRLEEMESVNEALVRKIEQLETEAGNAKKHMEAERTRAHTDSLTGLPNRAAYEDHLEQEFQRWLRYNVPFSIVVADIDHFKRINDNYGHLAGDKVLKLVGKLIKNKLRTTDFAARIGGEEFVMILPSSEREGSLQAMEKLRSLLETSPFNFSGKPVNITMSFGVAQINTEDTLESLFTRADQALYQAKADGRNCIRSK
ncbi:GGDEF domain-containing protein [Neptuniibacter sp. CAU 1671]|uniref:GGDEF domain-containing protein n=1 Tax=Neptuniibacter sp. CAU 1671 TaxID=3032593 RepID=UPI0023DB2343|nr:GGDEF domain-containing protein [Neptuniibacter sp. CAU 1671]MDF2182972.1 GGDEF domain-containing protein [Neptuniibacter sp. CAU 1671]